MQLGMSLSVPRLSSARPPACAQAHGVCRAWQPVFRSFGSRVQQARLPVPSNVPACACSLAPVPTLMCVQAPGVAAHSRRSLSPAWHAARPRCAACRASLAQAAFELADIDARTAGTIATVLRPVLSVGILLMIVRIVLSWYPQARLLCHASPRDCHG